MSQTVQPATIGEPVRQDGYADEFRIDMSLRLVMIQIRMTKMITMKMMNECAILF